MTYDEYKKLRIGTGVDIDGAYGFQCWDEYANYCTQCLNVPYSNCTVTGYVRDIWEQRKTNGMLKYFDEVHYMETGDIAVFKPVPNVTPYSHIAIFDHDIDGVYGMFLGQNQGGYNGKCNLVKFPYSATYKTGFRVKTKQSEIGLVSIPKSGTFHVKVDMLRIRNQSGLHGVFSGYYYNTGDTFNFDSVSIKDGYAWAHYISYTGVDRYVALGPVKNGKLVKDSMYGTF